jgi:hypothetical protein
MDFLERSLFEMGRIAGLWIFPPPYIHFPTTMEQDMFTRQPPKTLAQQCVILLSCEFFLFSFFFKKKLRHPSAGRLKSKH